MPGTHIHRPLAVEPGAKSGYHAALLTGSPAGAYVFGTLNVPARGQATIGRSIEGALLGGIVAVEPFKRAASVHVPANRRASRCPFGGESRSDVVFVGNRNKSNGCRLAATPQT